MIIPIACISSANYVVTELHVSQMLFYESRPSRVGLVALSLPLRM